MAPTGSHLPQKHPAHPAHPALQESHMPTFKTAAASKPAAKRMDDIALLGADHLVVSQLFAEYEKTRSMATK